MTVAAKAIDAKRLVTARARRQSRCRAFRSACSPGTTAIAGRCRGARRRAKRADPYRVWLSEIMLQQTTVRAVAPYYARFLARWPDVHALAAAPLDDVLKAWAGLGYYARARNLHACARAVVERHGGRFPAERERVARAAGHRRLYRRRHCGDRIRRAGDARSTAISSGWSRGSLPWRSRCRGQSRNCGSLRATLTPQRRAGDFAQAMMDLGATICTPKKPACALCPVERKLRRLRARRRRDIPAPNAETRRRLAPRRGFRRASRRRLSPGAHAAGEGLAWRHDRSADDRLVGGFR